MESLDINLNDTYFVLSGWHFLLFLFVFCGFLVYGFRALWKRFRVNRSVLGCLFFAVGLGIINLYLLAEIRILQYTSGWKVVQPRGSALPDEFIKKAESPVLTEMQLVFRISAFVLAILIAWLCYCLVSNYRQNRKPEMK